MQRVRFTDESGGKIEAVLRRARRTDFTAILQLLAEVGAALPLTDRSTLRRFRNIVNDLGSDLYLALIDETVVGLVHVSYTRRLCENQTARIEQWTACGRHAAAVQAALGELARARATKRGCARLDLPQPAARLDNPGILES